MQTLKFLEDSEINRLHYRRIIIEITHQPIKQHCLEEVVAKEKNLKLMKITVYKLPSLV